jgi:hypothetical protein
MISERDVKKAQKGQLSAEKENQQRKVEKGKGR